MVDLVKSVISDICANSLSRFFFSLLQPVRTSLCVSTCPLLIDYQKLSQQPHLVCFCIFIKIFFVKQLSGILRLFYLSHQLFQILLLIILDYVISY